MQPHQQQYAYSLTQRLDIFTEQTREDVAKLTGMGNIRNTNDPSALIRSILDNWDGDLEHTLPRHGVTFPLVDKVRRIRNDVIHRNGQYTSDHQNYVDAMNTIDTLQNRINSAGQLMPAHQPVPQNRPTGPTQRTGQMANMSPLHAIGVASVVGVVVFFVVMFFLSVITPTDMPGREGIIRIGGGVVGLVAFFYILIAGSR